MWNAGLDESQAGEKYQQPQRWHHSNGRKSWGIKSFLKRVKEDSEKPGLKLNIQKTKIMASSSITSQQIDEETMETITDFIFLGSKINASSDCSHEIKDTCSLKEKLRPT